MLLCACTYGVESEISLDTSDSASNAVVKRFFFFFFFDQRCAECVYLYTMDFVFAGNDTLWPFAKKLPRLNKHDDVNDAPPPKWRAGCAPGFNPNMVWKWKKTKHVWCSTEVTTSRKRSPPSCKLWCEVCRWRHSEDLFCTLLSSSHGGLLRQWHLQQHITSRLEHLTLPR